MAWFWPIVLLVVGEVLGRLNWMSAGYFLFRVTSDVERLPFPMAPVAASGATALAEAASKEESWRWRVFSTGTVIGLIFGFFYIAVPVFTGVVFNKAFTLIPIPFFDLTTNTETILPGAITGISGDLTKILVGLGSLPHCRRADPLSLGRVRLLRHEWVGARYGRHLHQAGHRHQVLDIGRYRLAGGGSAYRLLERGKGV